MKTTLDIADPLLREAKQLAARDGTTLRALVEQGLEKVVAERKRPEKTREWTIKPFHGQGLTDEFKNVGWAKIRNAAYGLPDDE
jgi:Bacterial antitoxin of type II TA system, VapB